MVASMKNEREQFRGARDGKIICKGKKNFKDRIFLELDSNLRELEEIFYAETNGTLSLQTPLDEILALESITGFAIMAARLYDSGTFLRDDLLNNASIRNADLVEYFKGFCSLTDQTSVARNYSAPEKAAFVEKNICAIINIKSSITKKNIDEHLLKEFKRIKEENRNSKSEEIYKKWQEWRMNDLYEAIVAGKFPPPEEISLRDAQKIKDIVQEVNDKASNEKTPLNGAIDMRHYKAREIYERLIEEGLIYKCDERTLTRLLDKPAHNP